jgi:hypothetical protein
VSESDNERLIRQLTPSVFQPQQEFASSRRAYAVAGELFPTNRLGVRIGYRTSDVEGFDDDIDAYDVAATWFFKPRVAIELSLGRVTVSGVPSSSDESESAAIRFIGRL